MALDQYLFCSLPFLVPFDSFSTCSLLVFSSLLWLQDWGNSYTWFTPLLRFHSISGQVSLVCLSNTCQVFCHLSILLIRYWIVSYFKCTSPSYTILSGYSSEVFPEGQLDYDILYSFILYPIIYGKKKERERKSIRERKGGQWRRSGMGGREGRGEKEWGGVRRRMV